MSAAGQGGKGGAGQGGEGSKGKPNIAAIAAALRAKRAAEVSTKDDSGTGAAKTVGQVGAELSLHEQRDLQEQRQREDATRKRSGSGGTFSDKAQAAAQKFVGAVTGKPAVGRPTKPMHHQVGVKNPGGELGTIGAGKPLEQRTRGGSVAGEIVRKLSGGARQAVEEGDPRTEAMEDLQRQRAASAAKDDIRGAELTREQVLARQAQQQRSGGGVHTSSAAEVRGGSVVQQQAPARKASVVAPTAQSVTTPRRPSIEERGKMAQAVRRSSTTESGDEAPRAKPDAGGGFLADITKGVKLKKAETVDKSAPNLGSSGGSFATATRRPSVGGTAAAPKPPAGAGGGMMGEMAQRLQQGGGLKHTDPNTGMRRVVKGVPTKAEISAMTIDEFKARVSKFNPQERSDFVKQMSELGLNGDQIKYLKTQFTDAASVVALKALETGAAERSGRGITMAAAARRAQVANVNAGMGPANAAKMGDVWNQIRKFLEERNVDSLVNYSNELAAMSADVRLDRAKKILEEVKSKFSPKV